MTAEVQAATPADEHDEHEQATWRLDELLASRRWVRRMRPFPHVYARDVFVEDFYQRLDDEFHRIERENPETFERNMKGYDASGARLSRFRDGPLGIFVSREWHDLIARVAGVRATGDVNAHLHHHDPGSQSGWPHNDLNPAWFAGPPPRPDEIRLEHTDGVALHTGERPPRGRRAREHPCGLAAVLPRQSAVAAGRRRRDRAVRRHRVRASGADRGSAAGEQLDGALRVHAPFLACVRR